MSRTSDHALEFAAESLLDLEDTLYHQSRRVVILREALEECIHMLHDSVVVYRQQDKTIKSLRRQLADALRRPVPTDLDVEGSDDMRWAHDDVLEDLKQLVEDDTFDDLD